MTVGASFLVSVETHGGWYDRRTLGQIRDITDTSAAGALIKVSCGKEQSDLTIVRSQAVEEEWHTIITSLSFHLRVPSLLAPGELPQVGDDK